MQKSFGDQSEHSWRQKGPENLHLMIKGAIGWKSLTAFLFDTIVADEVVFVIVSIDNLNDFSKLILSTAKIPDKINKLIKKDMNIKKEILILSSVIFFSVLNIFLLSIVFGLINFIISRDEVLSNI